MTIPTPDTAWRSLVASAEALHAEPMAMAGPGPGALVSLAAETRLGERSEVLLERSQALRAALMGAEGLTRPDQQALAQLKLLAASAYDLALANDLIELAQRPIRFALEEETPPLAIPAEIIQVMEAPLELGMEGLARPQAGELPEELGAARDALVEAVRRSLAAIPEAAATLAQTAVAGVATLGLGPIHSAASLATQQILAKIPEGASAVVRRVAAFVVEAVLKIRAALGDEIEEEARAKVTIWLNEIREQRDTVQALLARLYQIERIQAEADGLLAAPPATITASQINQATRQMQTALAAYQQTRTVLIQVMRVMSLAQKPLLAAVPWGPLAIFAGYAGILVYAVLSGGDYVDWYPEQSALWLGRVPGVRTTLQAALGGQALETGRG
jgi:hypothetical protein